MVSPLLPFRHGHSNVARSLQYLINPPACSRPPALKRSACVGERAGDNQLLRIHVEIVLRISSRGAQDLGDRTCAFLWQVPENRNRLVERLAAYGLEDQAHLLRRDQDITCHGANFDTSHDYFPPLLAPTRFFAPGRVTAERSCWSKFTEFMAHHVLRDEDRDVPPPIVDGDSMTNHLREDR